MHERTILFDFDGVIVDSFRLCLEVSRTICPHITASDYKAKFEGNINDWQDPTGVHTSDCRPEVDFFSEYIPRMMSEAAIVPGIADAIIRLNGRYNLIVISSTVTSPIRTLLVAHGLAKYFVEIMGNDVHKSKVEKIRMVLSKYAITEKECIFVTDTLGDIREATKVGVGAIGVTWGFHEPMRLAKGHPFRLVSTPKDLESAINDYFV
jgi:phosphoglycolate phosphatase-like HAD superfamily hydrolase